MCLRLDVFVLSVAFATMLFFVFSLFLLLLCFPFFRLIRI